jgi:hypothetical protein
VVREQLWWRSEDGGCDEFTASIDAQNAAPSDVLPGDKCSATTVFADYFNIGG